MPRTLATRSPAVAVLSVLVAGVLALAGCSKDKPKTDTGDLPSAGGLLVAGADAMRNVPSAHFHTDAQGTISGLALHKADGVLTLDGRAKGTATVEQVGSVVELDFVIVGTSLYLKGPTGGYQKLPLALAATVYDPSAIL